MLRKFGKFLALNEIIPKASVEERPIHTKARKHENNTLGAFAWLPLVLASPLLKELNKIVRKECNTNNFSSRPHIALDIKQ